jgi:hypothetical protein
MTRKVVRCLLTFYLTAPLFGVSVAVGTCLAKAWRTHDPYLAAASVIFGACATGVFVLAFLVVRQLTKGP